MRAGKQEFSIKGAGLLRFPLIYTYSQICIVVWNSLVLRSSSYSHFSIVLIFFKNYIIVIWSCKSGLKHNKKSPENIILKRVIFIQGISYTKELSLYKAAVLCHSLITCLYRMKNSQSHVEASVLSGGLFCRFPG